MMARELVVLYETTDHMEEEEYVASSVEDAARFISSMGGFLLYADVLDESGELIEID